METVKSKKTVLLSFDYELFLGKDSGTVENCMTKPTTALLKVFKENDVKGVIFFVDVTYLCALKQRIETCQKIQKDYYKICDQIIEMVKQGHYVFPHIHPHWLDAVYDENKNTWDLSVISKYRFFNLSEKEKESVFTDGINILKEIVLPQFPDYKLDSYRAGGLSIQPFQDFMPYFIKHGITNDFSVLPKMFEIGSVFSRFFDFRKTGHLNHYKFSTDVEKIDYTGNFNEFTISKIRVNYFEKLLNKIILKINTSFLSDINYGDGIGSNFSESFEKSESSIEVVSVEWCNWYKIYKYLQALNKTNYLHFLSHPKMLTPKNIKVLEIFLKKIKRENVNFDFKSLIAKKPSVVICSYIMPPEPGIGGRRWAKFAKYFKRDGYDISVVTAELSNYKNISPWVNDVKDIKTKRLPRKYPGILDTVPKNIFEKIVYFGTRTFFEMKISGTIYDRSVNWGKQFNKYFDEIIIKNNVYCVISTGAPFNLMYYTARLKDRYSHLKVINDFRDPWTWGEIYGFKGIEDSRLKFEQHKEKETIRLSDYVTCSADFIFEVLKNNYPEHINKLKMIPHGFDRDDFIGANKKNNRLQNKIKILYGGTLYENLSSQLEFIFEFAKQYSDLLEIDFYTSNNQYGYLFEKYALKNVRIHSQVNAIDFFKIINDYNYHLCITNERIKDNISTKYYEIFANNIPILYLGPDGYISKMISDNDVGILIDPKENLEELFLKISNGLYKNWGFDRIGLEKYDFKNLSLDFEKLILSS